MHRVIGDRRGGGTYHRALRNVTGLPADETQGTGTEVGGLHTPLTYLLPSGPGS